MLTYPGFNPIAFEIGPVKVHWYGIMYLLGFGGAWWLARRRAAKPGSSWKPDDVDDLIFFRCSASSSAVASAMCSSMG